MRSLVLAVVLAIGIFANLTGSVLAQTTPQFRTGFAVLAGLIPDVVGQPVADEQFNPQTGQSVQPTTRGLMVWRKGDHATAFTNGSTTWLLGPGGLQQRPNGMLFAWERPVILNAAQMPDADPNTMRDSALQQLRAVPEGAPLVSSATRNEILIEVERLPHGVLGAFIPEEKLVILASQLQSAPAKTPADVLAHELQHASDLATMGEPQTPAQCYNFEKRAFFKQAEVWRELWGGQLPPANNPYYAEFNDIATTVATNPDAFAAQLVQRYHSECGALP